MLPPSDYELIKISTVDNTTQITTKIYDTETLTMAITSFGTVYPVQYQIGLQQMQISIEQVVDGLMRLQTLTLA